MYLDVLKECQLWLGQIWPGMRHSPVNAKTIQVPLNAGQHINGKLFLRPTPSPHEPGE
jgi:hypothetical protein